MTDFKKIAKSIVVHFAHICAYGVETVNRLTTVDAYVTEPGKRAQLAWSIIF